MQCNFLQILGERGTGTDPGGNALPSQRGNAILERGDA